MCSGSKSEGGECVCDVLSLFTLKGLSGGVFLHAADTDGRGIAANGLRCHKGCSVIFPYLSFMEPVSSCCIASLCCPEGDGLLLLLMGVFGERTVCAERLSGTDGAVRVRCVTVKCNIVSGADCGGQGGGDRLGGMHICRLDECQEVYLLSCRLCHTAIICFCFRIVGINLCVQRIKDDAVLCIPCSARRISEGRTGR